MKTHCDDYRNSTASVEVMDNGFITNTGTEPVRRKVHTTFESAVNSLARSFGLVNIAEDIRLVTNKDQTYTKEEIAKIFVEAQAAGEITNEASEIIFRRFW